MEFLEEEEQNTNGTIKIRDQGIFRVKKHI